LQHSFSFVVPALNEGLALAATLDEIIKVMDQGGYDYEILVFDDASSDNTGQIADEYANKYRHIRAFHNPNTPQGIGYSYKKGIELASKEYYSLIHGDNEINAALIKRLLETAGKADFSITYIEDDLRSSSRKRTSHVFTGLMNFLFGLNVPYYNGPSLIPLKLLREIPILTNGHAFMAEIIVRLIKKGYVYEAIGFQTQIRCQGKSKAFRPKNIISVLRALIRLRLSLRK